MKNPSLLIILLSILLNSCGIHTVKYFKLVEYGDKPEITVFRDVDIFDGETAWLIRNMDVVVENGKIKEIKETGGSYDPMIKVIECDGKTLLPGYVDAHVHVGSMPSGNWYLVLPNAKANLRCYLYAGVTTVYDMGGNFKNNMKLHEKVEKEKVCGPSIYSANTPITIENSHPLPMARSIAPASMKNMVEKSVYLYEGPESADAIIADIKSLGAHYVKIIADALPESSPQMNEVQMKIIVDKAHAAGLKVFVHVGSVQNALDATRAGADGLMHMIYKDALTESQAKEIAKAGVPIAMTSSGFKHVADFGNGTYEPSEWVKETTPAKVLEPVTGKKVEEALAVSPVLAEFAGTCVNGEAHWKNNTMMLYKAGVNFLVGTDSPLPGVYAGGAYQDELRYMKELGMSNYDILMGATSRPAGLFIVEPDFGRIKAGYQADLVLVDGNPLDNIENAGKIVLLMKDGRFINRIKP